MAPATTKPSGFTLTIKNASALLGGIVTLLGSVWAIDSHYASAADVEKLQQTVQSQVSRLESNIQVQFVQTRIDSTSDELNKLKSKRLMQRGVLNEVDKEMYDTYMSRLNDAKNEKLMLQARGTGSINIKTEGAVK